MIKRVPILIIFLFSMTVEANELISDFLDHIRKNAIDYQITSLESTANVLNIELGLNQFDLNGFLKADYLDSDNVAASPFSPSNSKSYDYSLGLNKKWSYGFESNINYTLIDNLTQFPSASEVDYLSPDLSISFKTNLVQDLIYGQSRSIKKKIKLQVDSESLSEKIRKKTILVNSLLLLSQYLELKEEQSLQKNLCFQIEKQVRKLKIKSNRGSVPKRDYLLSLKDLNSCHSSSREIENNINNKRNSLEIEYGVSITKMESIRLGPLFDEIVDLYNFSSGTSEKADIFGRDELLYIKRQLQASNEGLVELNAKTKLPLSFDIKFGLKGLQDNLSDAHKDVSSSSFPYVMGTLELKFPFSNREVKSKMIIGKLQKEILKKRLDKENAIAKRRFQLLKDNVSRDIKSYSSYLSNVKLSWASAQRGSSRL